MSRYYDENAYADHLENETESLDIQVLFSMAIRCLDRVRQNWSKCYPQSTLIDDAFTFIKNAKSDSLPFDQWIAQVSQLGVNKSSEYYEECFPCMDLSQAGEGGVLISNATHVAGATGNLIAGMKDYFIDSNELLARQGVHYCIALCWAATNWSDSELDWQESEIEKLNSGAIGG